MAHDRLFRLFESERDARLFAVFRMAFYLGLLLHFGPTLVFLDENCAPDVVRLQRWSALLYERMAGAPPLALRLASLATLAALVAGLVGFRPRVSAIVALLGTYSFASCNALPVFTLALANAWAILPVLCVCRGAAAAWSVDAWLRRRAALPPLPAPTVLANLVLWQLLLAFTFAGAEKLMWGWPFNDEMGMLFKTPRGWILRDWAWSWPWLQHPLVTAALSWLTVAIELTVAPALFFRRTRLFALFVYEAMFLGIVALIEVPPLFFAMFAVGVLLVLDEADRDRLVGLARRLRRAVRRAG